MSKRRLNGEGSTYQRKDGRWASEKTLEWRGTRKRVIGYGRTAKDAKDDVDGKIRRRLAELEEGAKEAPETLDEYARRWLPRKSGWSPNTRASNVGNIRLHLSPTFGDVALRAIDADMITAWVASLEKKGLSPKTRLHCFQILHQILDAARAEDLIPKDPTALVDRPKPGRTNRAVRPLNPQQARDLVAAIAADPLEPYFLLELLLGLRSGEVRALTWDDVDFEAGRITVLNSIYRVKPDSATKGNWQLKGTKSEAGQRTLPVGRTLLDSLRRHRTRQDEQRRLMGDEWKGSRNLVFTNERGGPMWGSYALNKLRERFRQEGIPEERRQHDLRHTFASLAKAANANPAVLKDLMGHSQMAYTTDLYGFAPIESMRQVHESVGNYLANGDDGNCQHVCVAHPHPGGTSDGVVVADATTGEVPWDEILEADAAPDLHLRLQMRERPLGPDHAGNRQRARLVIQFASTPTLRVPRWRLTGDAVPAEMLSYLRTTLGANADDLAMAASSPLGLALARAEASASTDQQRRQLRHAVRRLMEWCGETGRQPSLVSDEDVSELFRQHLVNRHRVGNAAEVAVGARAFLRILRSEI